MSGDIEVKSVLIFYYHLVSNREKSRLYFCFKYFIRLRGTTQFLSNRVVDPHRFNSDPDTDPDPAFFIIADPDPDHNADPDPVPDPGF